MKSSLNFTIGALQSLTINISKTHYMIFSNKPIPDNLPPMAIKNGFEYNVISRVNNFKFLGVFFDERLKFNFHTSHLTNKLSQISSMLLKVSKFLPCHILKTLYYAHVHSILSYCINLWGGTNGIHLNSLNIMFKRIIRIINNADFLDHTRPLLKSNKLLNIYDLYRYTLLKEYFTIYILVDRDCQYPRHNYNTRNHRAIMPDRHRRTIFERSFLYAAPYQYNRLPPHLKAITTLNKFKRALKDFYLSQY